MTQMSDNIFEALLKQRPREGRNPWENFLTAAFAHTLHTNRDICRAWLSELTGTPLASLDGDIEIETQVSVHDPGATTRSILDMTIHCGTTKLIFEHKWDSNADSDQLDRYLRYADAERYTTVVFIAPRPSQVAEVRNHINSKQHRKLKAIHWYDVHRFLVRASHSERVREFAEFLILQNFCQGFHMPSLGACSKSSGSARIPHGTLAWSCVDPAPVIAPYVAAPAPSRKGREGVPAPTG